MNSLHYSIISVFSAAVKSVLPVFGDSAVISAGYVENRGVLEKVSWHEQALFGNRQHTQAAGLLPSYGAKNSCNTESIPAIFALSTQIILRRWAYCPFSNKTQLRSLRHAEKERGGSGMKRRTVLQFLAFLPVLGRCLPLRGYSPDPPPGQIRGQGKWP
ncbi:MAG: hypothetical protein HFG08_08695 [Oscillibacter sp.]|nr:hypothetical protein [Oscillibacter sp.]